MPKQVKFHGAFSDRKRAQTRADKVNGKIKRIKVRGQTRYSVVTRRKS